MQNRTEEPFFSMQAWLKVSILFFISLLVVGSGCQGIEGVDSGTLLVVPNPISFSQTLVGASSEVQVQILNSEDSELKIFEVKVVKGSGEEATDVRLQGLPSGEFVVGPSGSKSFKVVYTPTVSSKETTYYMVVRSSDGRYSFENPYKVEIAMVPNKAQIEISPSPLMFAKSKVGKQYTKQLTVRNYGSADLVLTQMPTRLSGGDFKLGGSNLGSLQVTQGSFPVTLKPYDPVKARQRPNDYELILDVIYAPVSSGEELGRGVFQFVYRDVGELEEKVTQVEVVAHASGKCIYVHPIVMNLGQVPIGKSGRGSFVISNCGSEELVVSEVGLSKNSADGEFDLDLQYPVDGSGGLVSPLTIAPGESSKGIEVVYRPVQEGSDAAQVTVKSDDSYQPELKVQVIARGSDGVCPEVSLGGYVEGVDTTPKGNVTMAPLQYLILDGSGSRDPDGRIVQWEWSVVKKPLGASSTLEPLANDPTDQDLSRRRYRPLVAGDYEFRLDVVDQEGFSGCAEKRVTMRAIPAKKIHIELTWNNPEDHDEADRDGSDVDLHLVKMGPGSWYEKPYDIYFQNMNNVDWNPERPTLDLDDRDGAGPENIQLDNPGDCQWYAVGVAYFKQRYGTAYVTVRIYVDQKLTFESTNLPLTQTANFYDIARIHWDGVHFSVQGVETFYKVHPKNKKPVVTEDMKIQVGGKALYCTAENLY